MSTYLRFQTNVLCPRARRPLGVFHTAGLLEDEARVEDYLRDPLTETLRWFQWNLSAPWILERDKRCVFWFRTDQQTILSRLWDLIAILIEHDVTVRRVKTVDPGMIVYRDAYQVAAIPNRNINQALRV